MAQTDYTRKNLSIGDEVLAYLEAQDNQSAFVTQTLRLRHVQEQSARLIVEVAQTALDRGYPESDERAFWTAAERFTAYRGGEPPGWLSSIGMDFTGPPFDGEQPRVEPGSVELPAAEIERVVYFTVAELNLGVESQHREIRKTVLDRYGLSEGPERVSSEELDADVEMETTVGTDATIVAERDSDE